jgi:hypothetical protein
MAIQLVISDCVQYEYIPIKSFHDFKNFLISTSVPQSQKENIFRKARE